MDGLRWLSCANRKISNTNLVSQPTNIFALIVTIAYTMVLQQLKGYQICCDLLCSGNLVKELTVCPAQARANASDSGRLFCLSKGGGLMRG